MAHVFVAWHVWVVLFPISLVVSRERYGKSGECHTKSGEGGEFYSMDEAARFLTQFMLVNREVNCRYVLETHKATVT